MKVDGAAKIIVDELESLLGNAASAVQTANAKDENVSCNLDSCITSSLQTATEKDEDIRCNLDSCITSTDQVNLISLSLSPIYIFRFCP